MSNCVFGLDLGLIGIVAAIIIGFLLGYLVRYVTNQNGKG